MTYEKKIFDSLKNLKILKQNNKKIIVKAKYGPSKPTKILLYLNEEISCFVAAIIGDGHLKKDKFQINLDGFDKILIENFRILSKKLFNREFNILKRFEKEKERYCLIIDSKAIYNLLNNVFKIPSGKKSEIVEIPKIIINSNNSIKSAFLIGIMLTEGGKRKRGFGLSTSSKKLWTNLIKLFKDVGIEVKTDRWIYKKYNKEYYGIYFKKHMLLNLIKECKNNQVKRILLKYKKLSYSPH